jgi:hypothetical protein
MTARDLPDVLTDYQRAREKYLAKIEVYREHLRAVRVLFSKWSTELNAFEVKTVFASRGNSAFNFTLYWPEESEVCFSVGIHENLIQERLDVEYRFSNELDWENLVGVPQGVPAHHPVGDPAGILESVQNMYSTALKQRFQNLGIR